MGGIMQIEDQGSMQRVGWGAARWAGPARVQRAEAFRYTLTSRIPQTSKASPIWRT
jgi:hypothetical protein